MLPIFPVLPLVQLIQCCPFLPVICRTSVMREWLRRSDVGVTMNRAVLSARREYRAAYTVHMCYPVNISNTVNTYLLVRWGLWNLYRCQTFLHQCGMSPHSNASLAYLPKKWQPPTECHSLLCSRGIHLVSHTSLYYNCGTTCNWLPNCPQVIHSHHRWEAVLFLEGHCPVPDPLLR